MKMMIEDPNLIPVGEGWCGWFLHQSAPIMHLQSTYTPHLQYLQSETHLEFSRTCAP